MVQKGIIKSQDDTYINFEWSWKSKCWNWWQVGKRKLCRKS